MNIESRIELLKKEIIKDDFLQVRGLGNEVPFWIFDYPPESELLIRHSMEKIGDILDNNFIGYIEIDLYEMCLETINKRIRPEKLIDFEAKRGSDELLKKLKIILKPDTVKQILKEKIESENNVRIIFLTGIGKAWPLIRSHSILNNLQPVTGNIPLVAFYPGEYRNYELSLFGRFKDANYYRAFRMINENTV
jgi:hypothetical protein